LLLIFIFIFSIGHLGWLVTCNWHLANILAHVN
jgi:hypothetical protein